MCGNNFFWAAHIDAYDAMKSEGKQKIIHFFKQLGALTLSNLYSRPIAELEYIYGAYYVTFV